MSRPSLVCLAFLLTAVPAAAQDKDVVFKSGRLEVRRDALVDANDKRYEHHYLMRDGTYYGSCILDAAYRRMPLTYYHPKGPLGVTFDRFNWFPTGEATASRADSRIVASLVLGADALGGSFPMNRLVSLWSEPPVAVIAMEAGTPAAYARPFQHFHFYEPLKAVLDLSEKKDPYFHFVADARKRGAGIQIVEGPPRRQLTQQGPRGFYHLIVMEACSGEDEEKIFLDLHTKEGISQCMDALVDDGILCVHTSHRYLDLPRVLAAIGASLKLHCRCGMDYSPGGRKRELADMHHFSSEWVLLARSKETLDAVCKTPPGYDAKVKAETRWAGKYWTIPRPGPHVWTDKGPNLLHEILRGHPVDMRYREAVAPVARAVYNLSRSNLGDLIGLDVREGDYYRFELMPRFLHDMFVEYQLQVNPQVEKLWPALDAFKK